MAGKTGIIEAPIQEYSGMITGKWLAGRIGAVHTRCKSDDQKIGWSIAKSRDRSRFTKAALLTRHGKL